MIEELPQIEEQGGITNTMKKPGTKLYIKKNNNSL